MSDCVLYALDATSGAELWDAGTLSEPGSCGTEQAAPIVDGGRVYASDAFSKVIATASTGTVIDRFRAFNYNGGAGVVVGKVWVYTDDTEVVARDTTNGRRAWTVPFPPAVGANATSVTATGDLLVVSSASGIAGLDRVTGEQVWDGGGFQGNALIREVLAIAGSRILVATQSGVRAYGPL
jgi:outer membrane protein assembly factor BamB